nr:CrcB family protein [Bifidobacterium platyrrhinorum]
MSAAHARSYAAGVPHPQGAAAAAAPPRIPLAPGKRMQAQFNPLADGMMYLVVFVGGCFGTGLRYALSLALPGPAAAHGFLGAFHTATFVANMAACFIFALVSTYMSQAAWIRKRVRQLASRGIGMGMCGGFSTLSAMVIEELVSIRADQIGGFLFYMLASFACGLAIAAAGVRCALALASRRSARVVAEALAAADATGHGGRSGRSGGRPAPAHAAPKRDLDGRALADKPIEVGDPAAGPIEIRPSTPSEGDRGRQPAHVASRTGAPATSPAAADAPAFEPAPITDEIPMVGDPVTGDAHDGRKDTR